MQWMLGTSNVLLVMVSASVFFFTTEYTEKNRVHRED